MCRLLLRKYLRCKANIEWYYNENQISPVEAILKYKQVVCVRRKMLFTIFKDLISFQQIFKFLKNAT